MRVCAWRTGIRHRQEARQTGPVPAFHPGDTAFPLAALYLALLLLLAGCAEVQTEPLCTSAAGSRLAIAAVPAARSRLRRWVEAYQQKHPDTAVDILPAAAGDPQELLAQGKASLAFLDRPPAEAYRGILTATLVAQEPIVLVIHPGNPLRDLSATVARELLAGRITNWSQVGGDDRPVQVYLLPNEAGAARAWGEAAGPAGRLAPQAQIRSSPASLCRAVAEDAGGIGLILLDDLPTELLTLDIDGAGPTDEAYPWHAPLFLAYSSSSPGEAAIFIDFVRRE